MFAISSDLKCRVLTLRDSHDVCLHFLCLVVRWCAECQVAEMRNGSLLAEAQQLVHPLTQRRRCGPPALLAARSAQRGSRCRPAATLWCVRSCAASGSRMAQVDPTPKLRPTRCTVRAGLAPNPIASRRICSDGQRRRLISSHHRAHIAFSSFSLNENDLEFTVMKIDIHEKNKKISINLFDEYNKQTNISSMARTTGYTCTACVNMLLENMFSEKGLFPLELIGGNKNCYNFIINYLEERGVYLQTSESNK